MSLHGITDHRTKVQQSQGISVNGQTPNTDTFCCAPTKCAIYLLSKIFDPAGRENWAKVHPNWLRHVTTNAHHHIKIHHAQPNNVQEKCYNFFYPIVNFGTPVDSLGKSSPNMEIVYSTPQSINVPNFIPI